MKALNIRIVKDTFAVCRLNSNDAIPTWVDKSIFYSITRTDDELSIVCSQTDIPEGVRAEKDWKAFKILGPLDFSLVGILNRIVNALAKKDISIFSISTYDTDYILVKTVDFERAKAALIEDGNSIV